MRHATLPGLASRPCRRTPGPSRARAPGTPGRDRSPRLRHATLAVAFVLGSAGWAVPASAASGLKVATPLLRVAEPLGTGRGSITIKTKGSSVTVKFSVAELADEVPAPLAIFLEDSPGGGSYSQVAEIGTLANGAGKLTLSSTDGPPEDLGVTDVEDLVGRGVQVRDANDTVLLDATIPELVKFQGTKLSATLAPPPGSPVPAASATLKGTVSSKKGSEKFKVKAKKLTPGVTLALFVEDAPDSGVFEAAGELSGSLYERNTADGDRLPLEVPAHEHLVGRKLEVRDGDVVVLAGTIEDASGPGGLDFPLVGVIILDAGLGGDDRYLRRVGTSLPLYRSVVDLDVVTIQELVDEGDAQWRLDKLGETAAGPICTVRLATDEDVWWDMGVSGGEHFVAVRNSGTDPATVESAQFVLLLDGEVQGKPAFRIESLVFPGEVLLDDGHILTANGVRVGPEVAANFVLH